jgi:hypothetical protein
MCFTKESFAKFTFLSILCMHRENVGVLFYYFSFYINSAFVPSKLTLFAVSPLLALIYIYFFNHVFVCNANVHLPFFTNHVFLLQHNMSFLYSFVLSSHFIFQFTFIFILFFSSLFLLLFDILHYFFFRFDSCE